MTKTAVTIGIVLLTILGPQARAQLPPGDSFPGVGDKAAWLRANSSYAEGNHLMGAKKWDAAIVKYQEAIARYPSDAHYHYNLGLAFKRKSDLTSAIVSLKEALALNGKDWKTWKLLGNCHYALGRFLEAKVAFERSLACAPPAREIAQLKAGIAQCQARSK